MLSELVTYMTIEGNIPEDTENIRIITSSYILEPGKFRTTVDGWVYDELDLSPILLHLDAIKCFEGYGFKRGRTYRSSDFIQSI